MKKKPVPFSRSQPPMYARDIDAPLTDDIEGVMHYATADDYVLGALVTVYEEALKDKRLDGPKHAICIFWTEVERYRKEGLLSEEEAKILHTARLEYTEHPLDNIPPKIDPKQIKAVQVLVKANSTVFRLPFVQDTMITLLRKQKYRDEPRDMRDKWNEFLTNRPKRKLMHSPDSIRFLIGQAEYHGIKTVDAPATIADGTGISEDKIKKHVQEKGKGKGRPKISR